jgi:hypothetical protein
MVTARRPHREKGVVSKYSEVSGMRFIEAANAAHLTYLLLLTMAVNLMLTSRLCRRRRTFRRRRYRLKALTRWGSANATTGQSGGLLERRHLSHPLAPKEFLFDIAVKTCNDLKGVEGHVRTRLV